MKSIKYSFVIFVLMSCSTPRVVYDFDRAVDFTQYKTYNYFAESYLGLSELDTKRLKVYMDSIMTVKGFIKKENPDILVNISSDYYEDSRPNTVGVGVGGTGSNIGGGISIGVPVGNNRIQQELTIDFIDAKKDDLIWQVKTQSRYKEKATPLEKEAYYKIIVEKAISEYPPIRQSP